MRRERRAETQTVRPRGRRKELIGMVTSAKMEKTIVVKVTRRWCSTLYARFVRVSKKFYAHDEKREAKRATPCESWHRARCRS